VNDVITYEITVENTGNVAIRSVVVTDPQATSGPTYVSGDANTDGILDVTETWTYEATYSITQADLDRGFFTNTASANGTYNNADGDPTPMMEASDDETVRVDADPSWTVTKTADPATYDAVNDVITYEITVENTGNVAIRSVVVTDPQATSGPTYVSGDANTDGIPGCDRDLDLRGYVQHHSGRSRPRLLHQHGERQRYLQQCRWRSYSDDGGQR
jgi:uncharacterized repeat protein (TIGR01451 family)